MKKILSVAAIIAVFANSSAFAKTKGNYVGVSLLNSSARYYSVDSEGKTPISKDSSLGFGLDYKHAFNFGNNVFVAPGVFFDKLGLNSKEEGGDLKVNKRYGAKLDIGYDVTHNTAVYFTNGLSYTNYRFATAGDQSTSASKNKLGYFFGAGFAHHLTKDVTLNVEYNLQKVNTTDETNTQVKTQIGVAKIGVAYHF
jgi:opacity protein-like surface antigen